MFVLDRWKIYCLMRQQLIPLWQRMIYQVVNTTLIPVLWKPVVRTSRIPCKASTGKQYNEQSDNPSPKKRRPVPVKPSPSSPSETHISAQKTKYLYPTRRLPPVHTNRDSDDTDDNLDECFLLASEVTSAPKPDPTPTKKKGTFTTKSHSLQEKIEFSQVHLQDVSTQK